MKTLLLILLLLTNIHTSSYGGNYNNSYSNHYNSYSSVSTQSEYRKIGYTTNYGNSFGQTTQQTYSDTYNQSMNITSDQEYSQNYKAPRKAKGDNRDIIYGIETSDDGTVTVNWSINGYDVLRWFGYYYIYVDGKLVDQGTMWRNNAEKKAHEKAKELANARSHSAPINDPDFYLVTTLLFSYFIYRCMKKRKRQFLLYTKIATN